MTDDNIIHLPLKMPPDLAGQVARVSRPPDPEYAGHPPLEPSYNPAAADWLKRKRELIKQASRQQCHEWLVGLVFGINGVTKAQTEGREVAIWSMCRALPDLVWCEETMQAMWARTAFLPTPGECREVFEAYLAPLLREIAALERIVAAPKLRQVVLPPYEPPVAPEWATKGSSNRFEKAYLPGSRPISEILADLKDRPVIERTPIARKPLDPDDD